MRVMLSNNTGKAVRELYARYPQVAGMLMGPGGFREPIPNVHFALDNGAYGAFLSGAPWDPAPFLRMLQKVRERGLTPLWVAVPDVVGDKQETLRKWMDWAPVIRKRFPGWPLAFVGQDGMDHRDVPSSADVVFVGGTTEWKLATVWPWCDHFSRVHVGRVNTLRRLRFCRDAGAESVDGTGWTRGDQKQWAGLLQFCREVDGTACCYQEDLFMERDDPGLHTTVTWADECGDEVEERDDSSRPE